MGQIDSRRLDSSGNEMEIMGGPLDAWGPFYAVTSFEIKS